MQAYGRLLRLSLAPSAAADVAAGTVLAAGTWPAGAAPFVLMLASLCVYHGGMALNDWADRAEDARLARPRPIPRGEIPAAAALALATALLLLGPVLALAAAPRAAFALALVALLALVYDVAGRGPWRGPLLLGGCRAGNLGAGLALGSAAGAWHPALALAPLAYGTYVVLVSRLARLEDRPDGAPAGGPGHVRAIAAALLAIGALAAALAPTLPGRAAEVVPGWALAALAVAVAGLGARGLVRAAGALGAGPWPAASVQRLAGMGLRRLLVATSALALGAGTVAGAVVSAGILGGYPLSFWLRRRFPPT